MPWVLAFATSPNVFSRAQGRARRDAWSTAFFFGADVGRRRADLGADDPLPGRGARPGDRLRLCAAAGTLIPPMLAKASSARPLWTPRARPHARWSGCWSRWLGIVMVGMAGMSKEKELPEEEKKKAVAEFNFKKGILVAMFSGVMSAGMSFGLQAAGKLENWRRRLRRRPQPPGAACRAGRGAARRLHRQLHLVPLTSTCKNKTTRATTRRRTPGAPLAAKFRSSPAFARRHLVLPVHLLQDRRAADGQDRLRRLDGADGQHASSSARCWASVLGEWKGTSSRTRASPRPRPGPAALLDPVIAGLQSAS